MGIAFKRLEFADLTALKKRNEGLWKNIPVFLMPAWLEAWWKTLRGNSELLLGAIESGGSIIGIVPLRREGDNAYFIGDENVCDYLDFIVEEGNEVGFYHTLMNELSNRGIKNLSLESLRYDSTVFRKMEAITQNNGQKSKLIENNVSMELDLPTSWQDYLNRVLSAKQRHEIKRKLRRLEEIGGYSYIVYQSREVIMKRLDSFITMFKEDPRKNEFLSPKREDFFRTMVEEMTGSGLLRLGTLCLNNNEVAAVLYFDYNNNIYLYNSAYEHHYDWLSVGLLSKVFCVKNAIELGRSRFDFLKGAEEYKYRMGGREIKLYTYLIELD